MFNKKAVSEVTSFIFLTLVIVVASTSAYFVSNEYLEDTVSKLDRDRMENYLKKIRVELDSITNFDNATRNFAIEFNSGSLVFNNSQVFYQSEVEFSDTDTYCFNGLCYLGVGGFERIYVNLSGSYEYASSLALEPESYIIIFKNRKSQNEIQVKFR